jgi:transcriptional regulator with XRE-family HTH domain
VLPTLPVAWPKRGRSIAPVVPDKERRDRLAFAIRYAMTNAGMTAEAVAAAMVPKRSKETVARWARGETVPSALDIGPLADALGVESRYLVKPPDVPVYPLAEYLIPEADAQRAVDLARASTELAREDLEEEARGRRAAARTAGARRARRPA